MTSKAFEVAGRECLDWGKQSLEGILSRDVLYKRSSLLGLGTENGWNGGRGDLSRKILADMDCQEDPIRLSFSVAKTEAEGINYLWQWPKLLTTSETTHEVFPYKAE